MGIPLASVDARLRAMMASVNRAGQVTNLDV